MNEADGTDYRSVGITASRDAWLGVIL